MKNIFLITFLLIVFSKSSTAFAKKEKSIGISEQSLDYEINLDDLKSGSFQYFYSLLKPIKISNEYHFENLSKPHTKGQIQHLVHTFLPLDIHGLWDPKENNYLAVAKFNYILPLDISRITEKKFINTDYIQATLPKYKVTKYNDYFHVDGSFLTPDFKVYTKFLKANDKETKLLKDIDREKIKLGQMKVSFMQQDDFGRVMFFKTAKMACAMIIYKALEDNQTLVTQYILSNVINVPTKKLIKKGMIENLKNVVEGSREAVRSFKID